MPSSASQAPALPAQQQQQHLDTLLASARPFLRGELERVDERLPSLVAILRSVGAGECWHKHGSFLDHLVDTYRILKLWNSPDSVCLTGLFHSAYSNSYVNLAIFDPSTGRDVVRSHVGPDAERLIHLFCIVPRQPLIHDDLLFKYSDEAELLKSLDSAEVSLNNAKEKGVFDAEEPWRRKLNEVLPRQGVVVKHIKTGDDVAVSRRVVAIFLLLTTADFSDQLFGFQDELFENSDGQSKYSGDDIRTLWPGEGKPGLWMNSLSRMSAVYRLIEREEEILMEERKRKGGLVIDKGRDEDIELVLPPVFDLCTKVLDAKEQIEARDMYWEAVCNGGGSKLESAKELLLKSVEKNPFVGEPHVVLTQLYLSQGRFEEAEREAEVGLRLLLEWGSPWDKRMSWQGWIAWCRVLMMKARERSWPQSAWGILNLGLVK